MVVCDVTSENKEVIKQLEDAHVSVQHRSRTKKDSSDEVLRQQMRKVVDTSAQPGRIVLISGGQERIFITFHLESGGQNPSETDIWAFPLCPFR